MEITKCSNKVLEGILEDLQKYKRTDKAGILQEYIALRLNKCLSLYYKDLDYTTTYLEHIDNVAKQKKIMKALGEDEED